MSAPIKFPTPQKQGSPAQQLMELARQDMAAVDSLITDRMQSPVGIIPDLAAHLVSAGGKRLRPLLTVASAALCDYDGSDHHKLAAAVEFIHSATLLHDDVVDESDLRRGKRPANKIWGNASSILVGDFLFAGAFNLMVETGSMEALSVLSKASSVIAEGEVKQLAALRQITITEADYMDVIRAKTAALFAAATEVAPIIANRSTAERAALRDYGMKIGLAFQLVDDTLDYGGMESALGKSIGDDFREGKVTLPVIRAYQQAGPEEKEFWHRVVVEHHQIETDLESAISYLRAAGTLESTLDQARKYASDARQALSIFPKSDWRETMRDLAGYVVDRIH